MPVYQFAPSSTHTAHVPFTLPGGVAVLVRFFLATKQNPTGPYDASVILRAADKAETATGVLQTSNIPITMPATLPSGNIYACAQIIFQGVPVLFGVDTTNTITGAPPLTYGTPTWDTNWQMAATVYEWIHFKCLITNPNSVAVTKIVSFLANVMVNSDGVWRPGFWGNSYPITIPANGSYLFDNCILDGIRGPGYFSGQGTIMIASNWTVQCWLTDSDGTESPKVVAYYTMAGGD